jgi:hypothetical protein
MQEKALWNVEHTTINTTMTQQLDLDGMDVLGEFGGHLGIRSDGSANDLGFSFHAEA